MLRIRLSRVGAKRQASYRVVVADVDARRDGRVVERIGFYNPRTEPETYRIDESRALYWLSVGAQPSDAVRRLLDKQGTTDRVKRFHAGETLEALVAEYEGTPLAAVPAVQETVDEAKEETPLETVPAVQEVVDEVKEEGTAVTADVVEEVSETVESVTETAEEAVEVVADVVAAVVEAVAGEEEE
jgi:small subunit ribosomal protein S16